MTDLIVWWRVRFVIIFGLGAGLRLDEHEKGRLGLDKGVMR